MIVHYPYIGTTWYRAVISSGVIYGWAYSKTKNLWVPITLHGLNIILIYHIFVRV